MVPDTCKVILPTAPERPVTCNGDHEMHSWFDFKSLKGLDAATDVREHLMSSKSGPEIESSI